MSRLAATAILAALVIASPAAQRPPISLSQLAWYDRAGKQLAGIGALADHGNIELSPDNMRIASAITNQVTGTRDIWFYDLKGGRTQFTTDAADENWLVWSPDGQRVALNSFTADRLALLQRPSAGGAPMDLLADATGKWPVSWSPDGQNLLFVANRPGTGNDVWVLPLRGDRRPMPFAATDAAENWATFSPDGKYVAFSSTEADGDAEVYVSPFPATGRKWRISADGGSQTRWRRNGELLYLSPDRQLISASIRFAGDELVVTDISPLFQMSYPYGAYHAFDVTKDGQRILINTTVVSQTAPTLSVSLNP